MYKTQRDQIIPHLHTLIKSLHQKCMDVVEGKFHCTKVVNLHEWKFYKKSFTERQHQKVWGYDIIATKNHLWMVENCAGVTPKPTQQGASKPLFQLGLVVLVINTLKKHLNLYFSLD